MPTGSDVSWRELDGTIEVGLNMRGFEIKTLKISL
jgi:hypothetical protein